MEKFFHILLTLLLLGLYSAPAFSVCHIEVTAGTAISNLFTTPRQGEGRVYEDGPVTVSMFDCEDAEPGWTWVWQKHDMANYYTAIQLGGSSVTISSSDPMFSSREMYGIHLTQWPIALAEKCKVGERCKLPLVADGRKLNDTNEVAVAFGKKPVAPSSLVVESCQHSEVDHMYNIHFSVSGGGDNDPGTGLGIGFIASENALYNGPFVERDENGNGEGDILVSDNVNTLFAQTAKPYTDLYGYMGYVALSDPISTPFQCGNYDFSVNSVKVTQAVFNPPINPIESIDIVKGKKAAVLVEVRVDGNFDLTDETMVGVKAQTGGPDSIMFTGKFRIGDVPLDDFDGDDGDDDSKTIIVELSSDQVLSFEGSRDLTIEVNPVSGVPGADYIPEYDTGNNTSIVHLYSRAARDLTLHFEKIDSWCKIFPTCFGDTDKGLEADAWIQDAIDFTSAIFPVREDGVKKLGSVEAITGSGTGGMLAELNGMVISAWLADMWSGEKMADRYVAIVPKAKGGRKSYFEYNLQPNTVGIHYGVNPKAVMVEETESTTLAHEIIHSFGLRFSICTGRDDDGNCTGYSSSAHTEQGTLTNGFWASNRGRGLRGSVDDLMNPEAVDPTNLDLSWIDSDAYGQLYCRFTQCDYNKKPNLRTVQSDAILISGTISSNGATTIQNAVVSPFPTELELDSGEAVIQVSLHSSIVLLLNDTQ